MTNSVSGTSYLDIMAQMQKDQEEANQIEMVTV